MFSAFSKSSGFVNLCKSVSTTALAYGAYSLYDDVQKKASNCGIIGYVGNEPNATDVLVNAINLLQNRGYDSAGMATLNEQSDLKITKLASDIVQKIDCIEKIGQLAPQLHSGSKIGIGHTRWATCGEKIDCNAHPHTDAKNRVAVAHNGTLENGDELREELQQLGIKLNSQTDSEVIPQFIGYYLDQGLSFQESIKKTLNEKVKGTWGLVIINKDEPDKIVACRNGSPIVVGFNNHAIYVASQSLAFEKYTNNYVQLNDGEIVYLDIKNRQEFYKNVKDRVKTVHFVDAQTKPKAPFTTFFEQEVMEQPESLMKCMNYGARLTGDKGSAKLGGFDQNKEELLKIKHLIIVACGSSHYASLFGARIFKLLGCFTSVQCFVASEFGEEDMPDSEVGVLVISQSGETADVARAMKLGQKKGFPTIGIVNVVGSMIATSVTCGVFLNTGREVSVPATKSFTGQCTALVLCALWFSHNKEIQNKTKLRVEISNAMHSLPISAGTALYTINEKCEELAKILLKEDHLFVLGKGLANSISKEAALKIKECTYLHAESFPSGELKHGPLSLIDSTKDLHTKVLLFILDDEHLEDMNLTLSEMKANKAYTIVITDCYKKINSGKVDFYIEIPKLSVFSSVLSILPIQKMCLHLAALKEINIDKPRNLAKTVTVQ